MLTPWCWWMNAICTKDSLTFIVEGWEVQIMNRWELSMLCLWNTHTLTQTHIHTDAWVVCIFKSSVCILWIHIYIYSVCICMNTYTHTYIYTQVKHLCVCFVCVYLKGKALTVVFREDEKGELIEFYKFGFRVSFSHSLDWFIKILFHYFRNYSINRNYYTRVHWGHSFSIDFASMIIHSWAELRLVDCHIEWKWDSFYAIRKIPILFHWFGEKSWFFLKYKSLTIEEFKKICLITLRIQLLSNRTPPPFRKTRFKKKWLSEKFWFLHRIIDEWCFPHNI